MPRAKVTSKGQVTIPAEVRRALGLAPGDEIVFEAKADYVAVRKRKTIDEVAGCLSKYAGHGLSDEEIKRRIGAHLVEMDARTKTGGDREG